MGGCPSTPAPRASRRPTSLDAMTVSRHSTGRRVSPLFLTVDRKILICHMILVAEEAP